MVGKARTWFAAGVLVATLFFLNGCSTGEWIEVTCESGHVATRLPRDPSSTYRHYGTRYESGYKAAESALGSLLPNVDATDTLKTIASDFRTYLTGERAAVEHQMEEAVAKLQSDPCDENARTKFQFLIQYVNFNGNYLHKIAAACQDSSANLTNMLEDYRRERN